MKLILAGGFLWLLNSAVQIQGGWQALLGSDTQPQQEQSPERNRLQSPYENQPSNEHQRRQRHKFAVRLVDELTIYDEGLEACVYSEVVRYMSYRNTTRLDNLDAIESLSCYADSIGDLTGIDGLTGLEKLNLSDNKLVTIGALQYHPTLKYLDLSGNTSLRSFDVLTSLPNLLSVKYPRDSELSCAKYEDFNERIARKRLSLKAPVPHRCRDNRYGYR